MRTRLFSGTILAATITVSTPLTAVVINDAGVGGLLLHVYGHDGDPSLPREPGCAKRNVPVARPDAGRGCRRREGAAGVVPAYPREGVP